MQDSRDINYCHQDLIIAFSDCSEIFENRYPDLKVICTQSTRTPLTQDKLYSQGRTAPGLKITNAKGGESPHNFSPSFAFDIAISRGKTLLWQASLYKEFAQLVEARQLNLRWGGDWDGDGRSDDERFLDRPHFELRNWKSFINK